MIPDDEDINPVIDFSWYYFIGKTRLGLSFRETGRITLRLFNKLYKHYKNAFDFEMRLKATNTTYEEAHQKANDAQEWF